MLHLPDLKEWASLLRRTRRHFEQADYIEVMTDHVVPAGAFESSIDPFAVSFAAGKAELHTSPEIEMKRLLAKHRQSIFQICRCFRDDPSTGIHRPEFTMLEFYRVGADWRAVLEETKNYFSMLAERPLVFRERTVTELFLDVAGIDLSTCSHLPTLRRAVERLGTVVLSTDDTWTDIYFKIWIEKIEPSLTGHPPLVVTGFPSAVSPLSAQAGDGWSSERFEIVWNGMELCNGCSELIDENRLRKRYEEESRERARMGKAPHPTPARLFEAAAVGIPPSAGVAVGLDRLYTCLKQTPP